MPLKRDNLRDFLQDKGIMGAIAYTFTALSTFAASPGAWHDKRAEFMGVLYSVAGAWVAAIAGQAYVKGKGMEGTVPEGREAAPAAPSVVVAGADTVAVVPAAATGAAINKPALPPGADAKSMADILSMVAAQLQAHADNQNNSAPAAATGAKIGVGVGSLAKAPK